MAIWLNPGLWNVGQRSGLFYSLFLLLADWKSDVMAGTTAIFLDSKTKPCWRRSLVLLDCAAAYQPLMPTQTLEWERNSYCYLGISLWEKRDLSFAKITSSERWKGARTWRAQGKGVAGRGNLTGSTCQVNPKENQMVPKGKAARRGWCEVKQAGDSRACVALPWNRCLSLAHWTSQVLSFYLCEVGLAGTLPFSWDCCQEQMIC